MPVHRPALSAEPSFRLHTMMLVSPSHDLTRSAAFAARLAPVSRQACRGAGEKGCRRAVCAQRSGISTAQLSADRAARCHPDPTNLIRKLTNACLREVQLGAARGEAELRAIVARLNLDTPEAPHFGASCSKQVVMRHLSRFCLLGLLFCPPALVLLALPPGACPTPSQLRIVPCLQRMMHLR